MINIDKKSKILKYQQIVNITLEKIKDGILKKGDILPSLNCIVREFSVSKDTVVKAYNILKEMNIVDSTHGKSFYIKNEYVDYDKKIFIFFDVLNTPYKENVYKGIMDNINGRIHLDFFFHNHNPILFKNILNENKENYDYFVVMPFPNIIVLETLQQFDQSKLLLLDIRVDYEGRNCSMISQSHNSELEKALFEGIDLINKYSRMTLVFPEDKHHPTVIKDAFLRFCRKNKIEFNIITSIQSDKVMKDCVYLIIEDDDLVNIIKASKLKKIKIGKDVGIISYNETSLKEVVENGITVVSTDFYEMGKKTAEHIIQGKKEEILLPTNLIIRKSL